MSFGIEIKNVDNNAIIDGENPQFLIRGAGTANFGSTAGTGYGTIPNSGNSGNGMLLGSDFLFGVPYSSSGFSSTAYVHFECTRIVGAVLSRLVRRWGRNESNQGSTPSPKPPSYKWFQVAPPNSNGFTPPASLSTDYGFEVYSSSGDTLFTTAQLVAFGTLHGIITPTTFSTSFSIGGETYSSAYTATFISPSGTDIYDYYVHCNDFVYEINPGNLRFAIKAVYHGQSRTITIISTSPFTFLIGFIRT
jgi:hypothetical protein